MSDVSFIMSGGIGKVYIGRRLSVDWWEVNWDFACRRESLYISEVRMNYEKGT